MDVTNLTGLLLGQVGLRPERCTRHISPRSTCRRCTEICPLGGIRLAEKGIKIIECNRCGLCTAVCPTEALQDPERTPAFFLARGRENMQLYGQAIFACLQIGKEQKAQDNWILVPCLAVVAPEVMLALAAEGEVVFYWEEAKCTGCQLTKGKKIFQDNFFLACEMAAALGFPVERVTINSEIPIIQPKRTRQAPVQAAMGRREFFASIMRGLRLDSSKKEESRPAQPFSRRAILREIWTKFYFFRPSREEGALWPQAGLKVVGPCYLCNVCSRLCPEGALILTGEELLFQPSLCSGCGLCLEVCIHQSLSWGEKVSLKMVAAQEKQQLTAAVSHRCPSCGNEYRASPRAELCVRCWFSQTLGKPATLA